MSDSTWWLWSLQSCTESHMHNQTQWAMTTTAPLKLHLGFHRAKNGHLSAQFFLFFSFLTSLNQYDTVAYDYPRQCLHFSLHLATSSTEVVVAPCYIRQRLRCNMCSKTDSHTGTHIYSLSFWTHAHTLNKTLHLTHCDKYQATYEFGLRPIKCHANVCLKVRLHRPTWSELSWLNRESYVGFNRAGPATKSESSSF